MRFSATEERVKITGRTLYLNETRYLGYSGSSVSFTFVGRKAVAGICSDIRDWPEELRGRIAVYVDGAEEPAKRICLDSEEKMYTLYESDCVRQVTITIMKYSEAAFGLCGIRYIEVDSDNLLPAPARKNRRMEIIGDSITCGYGVEAPDELTPFHTETENPAKSYSLLTAGALEAEVNLVCWSGNGIISKYVEESATEPLTDCLMPRLYQYTDVSGSQRILGENISLWERWDFERFIPDIIIINLGTNDCSWCKDIRERKDHFREEYIRFLGYVRAHNSRAEILCVLGTMDQRLLGELEEAVTLFRERNKDRAVHFLALPAQDPKDGYGADWHPCPYTQKVTAELVVGEVRKIMGW